MTEQDYANFAGMVSAMSDLLDRKPASQFSIALWWGALQHYDLAAIRQAFDRHVRNPDTGHFMPKPADVIRMLEGSTQDSALMAWAKVDRAMRVIGPYRSIAFDDALVHRVLAEMGGWVELSRKDEREWPFVEKEFVNRYRGYRSRNERPEYPPVLAGIAEAQNSEQGFRVEPPVLIGNERAAKKVIAGGSSMQLIGMTPAASLAAPAPKRIGKA